MVLQGGPCGRVGHRRTTITAKPPDHRSGGFPAFPPRLPGRPAPPRAGGTGRWLTWRHHCRMARPWLVAVARLRLAGQLQRGSQARAGRRSRAAGRGVGVQKRSCGRGFGRTGVDVRTPGHFRYTRTGVNRALRHDQVTPFPKSTPVPHWAPGLGSLPIRSGHSPYALFGHYAQETSDQ